ncbi:ABC transporter ATP-binding protein [Williamsoniiplasma somnilux]|uniref:ABC transporter ATP-binding protein n=1 Tax=Williamsoniiplasma somnilux TaxID=215578 RepID=A0A2K8NZ37_9MOLU|nr:ABC transporter permease [Williamsoniiplasma somnilux]ATZ18478.1 ABC transporter ATP-binding protein [Williamsoniiplasma somnilux]
MKTDFKLKQNTRAFNNVFLLVFKSFVRNPRGPLFMYVVPTFFMILFYFVLDFAPDSSGINQAKILLPYSVLPALTILTSLTPAIIEWKNSVLLKRVEITGISKSLFLLALWFVYFIIGLSGVIVEMLVALIIGQKDFLDVLSSLDWGLFIVGIVLTIFTSIAISSFIGGIMSSDGAAQGVIMMLYFFSIFMSGIMLPPAIIEGQVVTRIISFILPHKYAVYPLLYAQNSVGLQSFHEVWVPILISIGIIISFFVVTSFTFKWSSKK